MPHGRAAQLLPSLRNGNVRWGRGENPEGVHIRREEDLTIGYENCYNPLEIRIFKKKKGSITNFGIGETSIGKSDRDFMVLVS